jgi:hypothetical protein
MEDVSSVGGVAVLVRIDGDHKGCIGRMALSLLLGLAGVLCPAAAHGQFHQSQASDGLPLVATQPSGLAVSGSLPLPGSGGPSGGESSFSVWQSPAGDQRRDSTVVGVRPLSNSPAAANPAEMQDIQGLPIRTSLNPAVGSEGGEGGASQFSAGQLPSILQPPGGLPARSGVSQSSDPRLGGDISSQSGMGWRGAAPQSSGGGLGGSPAFGSVPSMSSGGLLPQFSNSGGGVGTVGGMTASPTGDMLAPTSRLLPNDQVDRARAATALAARQAVFAALDPSISLPDLPGVMNPAPRSVRQAVGGDGFEDWVPPGTGSRVGLEERPIVSGQPVGRTEEFQPTDPSAVTIPRGSGASMDTFSWWLMMCSVLLNAILFYFLYDSRAKYLNLADELQSRFFREG